ncbi:hypothetical protein Tco_0563446 [Tanacetum coccineum]
MLSPSGEGRKAHLLEDKQIPSVGVFDEVFSTWMAFGGNTRNLGSFGDRKTDKITDLHQIHEEVLFTEHEDGVTAMENVNPSSSTSNSEFLNPKKKIEIESWLEDSRIVDSLVSSDEIKYFDTFLTLEELEYHEWLLKCPKPP